MISINVRDYCIILHVLNIIHPSLDTDTDLTLLKTEPYVLYRSTLLFFLNILQHEMNDLGAVSRSTCFDGRSSASI